MRLAVQTLPWSLEFVIQINLKARHRRSLKLGLKLKNLNEKYWILFPQWIFKDGLNTGASELLIMGCIQEYLECCPHSCIWNHGTMNHL